MNIAESIATAAPAMQVSAPTGRDTALLSWAVLPVPVLLPVLVLLPVKVLLFVFVAGGLVVLVVLLPVLGDDEVLGDDGVLPEAAPSICAFTSAANAPVMPVIVYFEENAKAGNCGLLGSLRARDSIRTK
jgi:hypothetical protein